MHRRAGVTGVPRSGGFDPMTRAVPRPRSSDEEFTAAEEAAPDLPGWLSLQSQRPPRTSAATSAASNAAAAAASIAAAAAAAAAARAVTAGTPAGTPAVRAGAARGRWPAGYGVDPAAAEEFLRQYYAEQPKAGALAERGALHRAAVLAQPSGARPPRAAQPQGGRRRRGRPPADRVQRRPDPAGHHGVRPGRPRPSRPADLERAARAVRRVPPP